MQIINHIRANPGLYVSLLAVALFEVYYYSNHAIADGKFVDAAAISETHLLRIFLLSCLGYFIVFYGKDRQTSFRTAISAVTIFVAAASVWLVFNYPLFADLIAKEDDVVENMSAGFLFLASATAVIATVQMIKYRRLLLALILSLVAVVLFVIGMEEISWMQRILDIESTGVFLEGNVQQETNLHNFYTTLFENIYYIGAIIVLIILPAYHSKLSELLSRFRLKQFAPLLPSPWLLVPFAVMVGFVKSSDYYLHTLLAFAIPLTIMFLIARLISYYSQTKPALLIATLASLIIVVVSTLAFLLMDYGEFGIRRHIATEYRELFIAIGLFAYIVDVRYKLLAQKTK